MVAFRWIQMFSFLILVLQFTAVTVQSPSPYAALSGVDILLPCRNVTDDQCKYGRITWTFSHAANTVTLFEHGTHKDASAKLKRKLNVKEDCSLEIKKTTVEDSGRYNCTKFSRSGQRHGQDAVYALSVVNSFGTKTTKTKPTTTTTIKSTSTSTNTKKPAKPVTTNSTTTWTNATASADNDQTKPQAWWEFVIVAVVVAALVLTAVAVVLCNRADGNKAQRDENTGLTLNPEGTETGPATSWDTAGPEDGAYYTSVSYIKKSKTRDEVENEADTVIYSTVKTSSPSAAASADPSDLYAPVNKLKK